MRIKIVLLIITVSIVVFIGVRFLTARNNQKITSPLAKQNITPAKTSSTDNLKEYTDSSGFKFSYPKELTLESVDKKDPAYYSSILLKSDDVDGSITIDVTSTKYKSLDEWMKKNETLLKNTKDIKLADLKAKDIKYDGKHIILAVDVGTLFTITSNYSQKNEKYWTNATDTITSAFAFQQPETSSDSTPQTSEQDVVLEGEEVVE